jgi:hypothetical protein
LRWLKLPRSTIVQPQERASLSHFSPVPCIFTLVATKPPLPSTSSRLPPDFFRQEKVSEESEKVVMAFKIAKSTRLSIAIGISFSFFIAEIAIGFKTRSIALIADAFHYVSAPFAD